MKDPNCSLCNEAIKNDGFEIGGLVTNHFPPMTAVIFISDIDENPIGHPSKGSHLVRIVCASCVAKIMEDVGFKKE